MTICMTVQIFCNTNAAIGTIEERTTDENVFVMAFFVREASHFHHNNNDFLQKIQKQNNNYNRVVQERQHPEKVCSYIRDFGNNAIIVT